MLANECWQTLSRYSFCCVAFCICLIISFKSLASTQLQSRWQQIESLGKNQSVYFYAWGGDAQINAYIQWAAQQVKAKYNINLVHVKLSDTSEAVSRVLAEKSANNNDKGSVDLIWINGANFATMSEHSLLLKQWANKLPNFSYTDPSNNPAVNFDFGIPTNGMEAPWGQASLTFYYDSLAIDGTANNTLPTTLNQLLSWSAQNPGRFSYPKPPDFLGMSFLKYALVMLHQQSDDTLKAQLNQPATAQNTAQVLNPLWDFLNKLHPTLWRGGKHFMQSGAQMRRLVGDTELSIAFTFSAPEVPAAVKRYDLPKSIRSYAMQDGSLSNTHFVAIPYNASHQQSAQLVANFLLSPEAQAQKQKAPIWGDKSVLIQSTLTPQQQALFKKTQPHPSALPLNSIKRTLSEPHPSWVNAILQGWQARFGVSQ
ncbi:MULTISPECIES: ABC transporter substrate-binding protein [unclassified Pseudoalteromonas]|uniref:ABC transporter substrate-binding protein n=1 Tax=unclassified Pseudoalteromonas TaxID=194690 RepID=UPI00235A18B5|nr:MULTISPECIES: ABC transporter substrate-binding protein [unclassified Pseudoalteromonas]MDC9565476.1 ABC transporter substrate-binding protein [Pseudoalteromonas sp. GAB2316C]MDC9569807.1 ABC transporter substrate-binding protein [Pseudoalteromonas sp. GABNB9D]MDC9574752.1 ABC transporter substrate-binding protein [Pseudoalteromonas sp. GABNS16A]MDC9578358.1 ABC transporter substrate-binding protein [Pseudoalteromonas sp. GABNS16E]MDC9585966.1 ABC transporter substrate-binding protein [Pseu